MDSKQEGAQEALAECERRSPLEGARLIALDQIRVDGNPRSAASAEGIARLARSIALVGLNTPLTVAADEGGEFALIAGGRRLEALRELGWSAAPCVVVEADGAASRLARAAADNTAAEPMSPGDEARAISAVIRERGATVAQAAELLGISEPTAQKRLELLKLPAEVRARLDEGELSLGNGLELAKMAEGSRPVARAIARRVGQGLVTTRALDADPGACLQELAAEGDPAEALCLPFSEGQALELSEAIRNTRAALEAEEGSGAERALERLVELCEEPARRAMEERAEQEPDERRKAQIEREHEAPEACARRWERFCERFRGALAPVRPEDVIRARAYGALIEYQRDRYSTASFLVSGEFAVEFLVDALERAVRPEDSDRPRREAAPAPAEPDDRKRRLTERERARSANAHLGMKLKLRMDHQGEVSRDQAEALAALVLDSYERPLREGLRLVHPDFQRVERRMMRSGAVSVKERYADPDESRALVERYLASAPSAEALVGRLFAALAAAALSDQRALPEGQRRAFSLPHALGREQSVFARGRRGLWAEAGELLPEGRYAELRDEYGEAPAAIRDRRSDRQIARSEREREEVERRLGAGESGSGSGLDPALQLSGREDGGADDSTERDLG